MPKRTRPPYALLLGVISLLSLVASCGEPTTSFDRASNLPPGELIVLGAEPHNAADGYGLYLLDPASGAFTAWQLQGDRGLTENGSLCISIDDQRRWDATQRELILSGSLGCTPGLYRIASDGVVIEERLPALPEGVELPKLPISAPAGGATATVGSIYTPPGPARAYLYMFEPGVGWTAYGEGMEFEEIAHLRWSPDGSALAFIGGTRPGGVYQRRAYLVDLGYGELRLLSQDEALIDSVPAFTADGAVVFAGAPSGGPPAIYLAEPGDEALPIVDLGALPDAAGWRGALALSPDGRLAAFSGQRDNPTTPWTIYGAELETGELSDLLPAELADERSGATPDEAPVIEPLTWSPDSRRLLVVADLAGICSEIPVSGAVSCTRQLYGLPASGGSLERLGETQLTTTGFALWVE